MLPAFSCDAPLFFLRGMDEKAKRVEYGVAGCAEKEKWHQGTRISERGRRENVRRFESMFINCEDELLRRQAALLKRYNF